MENDVSSPPLPREVCDIVHMLPSDNDKIKAFAESIQLPEYVATHGVESIVKKTVTKLNRSVRQTRMLYKTYVASRQHWKNVGVNRCCCRACKAYLHYVDVVHDHLFTLISQRRPVEVTLDEYVQGQEHSVPRNYQLGVFNSDPDGHTAESHTYKDTDVNSEPTALTNHEQEVHNPVVTTDGYARERIDVGSEEVNSPETSLKV